MGRFILHTMCRFQYKQSVTHVKQSSTHVNHTHHPLWWDFLNNKFCDHLAFESIVEIVHIVYSSFSATNGILDLQMDFKIYLLLTFRNISLHFKCKKLTTL